MSYWIGSKLRLERPLGDVFGRLRDDHGEGFIVDMFCGTGAASSAFQHLTYYPLIINDALVRPLGMSLSRLIAWPKHLRISAATLEAYPVPAENPFSNFAETFAELGAGKRLFFSYENGQKIAEVLHKAHVWSDAMFKEYAERFGASTVQAYVLAVYACIADAVDRVSNTAGTYATYMKKLKPAALKDLALDFSLIYNHRHKRDIDDVLWFNEDIQLDTIQKATPLWTELERNRRKSSAKQYVYLDPPYVDRRYDRIYHLSEAVMRRDPSLFDNANTIGISGRPRNSFTPKSDWTRSATALKLLNILVRRLKDLRTTAVVMSYSNQALMDVNDIVAVFENCGYKIHIDTHRVNPYRSHANIVQKEVLLEYIITAQES